MDRNSESQKPSLFRKLGNQYSGALTPIALSALSAWLIVTGVKGLAGFTVNQQTALADLVGIILVIGAARWMKLRSDAK